jgi:hypothetical protein
VLEIQKITTMGAGLIGAGQALAAACLLSVATAFGASSKAEAATVDLTGDVWDVEGVDIAGNDHGDSTLFFETQTDNGDGSYALSGYFDWIVAGPSCPVGCSGRELFTGALFNDLSFELTGFEYVDLTPIGSLILGFYTAFVTPDGLNIVGGAWDGATQVGIPADDWSASRAGVSEVPLPAAAPLFLSVLAGAFGWNAARRRSAGPQDEN